MRTENATVRHQKQGAQRPRPTTPITDSRSSGGSFRRMTDPYRPKPADTGREKPKTGH